MEGDGDACSKAFSLKCGSTQGVFNVVCPHVVTLGFRCLFHAESVGEALSIVLERFPKLPRVIFYDVACKIDKNGMRRVRPIFRAQGVRCLLDRPHSITHSCSPAYMPDESLGTTAGVATQAAEVSHSISVVNRTSLAYMAPQTYMSHRMVQVAFMNVRKLYRLHSSNGGGENDHIPLAPFFHSKLAHQCERVSVCSCASAADLGGKQIEGELAREQPMPAAVGSAPLLESNGHDGAGGDAADEAGAAADPGDADSDGVDDPVTTRAVRDVLADDDELDDLLAGRQGGDRQGGDRPGGGAGAVGVGGRVDPPGHSDEARKRSAFEQLLDDHAEWARTRPLFSGAPMDTRPLTLAQVRLLAALTGLRSHDALRPRNRANIDLVAADLQRLVGTGWLDDELMNSFVALLNDRDLQVVDVRREEPGAPSERTDSLTPQRRRTRVFNTFFFSRLSATVAGYDYSGVRRWGMKLGLELDAIDNILVPINLLRSHWVLVNIDIKERVLQFYDSLSVKDTTGVVPVLRRWLQDEVRARLGGDAATEWAVDTWPVLEDAGLPSQRDSGSCGVFVLAAADCFSLECPLSFSQEDMCLLRGRVGLALFFDDLHYAPDLLGDHPFNEPVLGPDDLWGDGEDEDVDGLPVNERE